jgi:hypothetical protein
MLCLPAAQSEDTWFAPRAFQGTRVSTGYMLGILHVFCLESSALACTALTFTLSEDALQGTPPVGACAAQPLPHRA